MIGMLLEREEKFGREFIKTSDSGLIFFLIESVHLFKRIVMERKVHLKIDLHLYEKPC